MYRSLVIYRILFKVVNYFYGFDFGIYVDWGGVVVGVIVVCGIWVFYLLFDFVINSLKVYEKLSFLILFYVLRYM